VVLANPTHAQYSQYQRKKNRKVLGTSTHSRTHSQYPRKNTRNNIPRYLKAFAVLLQAVAALAVAPLFVLHGLRVRLLYLTSEGLQREGAVQPAQIDQQGAVQCWNLFAGYIVYVCVCVCVRACGWVRAR